MKKLFWLSLALLMLLPTHAVAQDLASLSGLGYQTPAGFTKQVFDPLPELVPVPLDVRQLVIFQSDASSKLQMIVSEAPLQTWVEESQLRYLSAQQTSNRELLSTFGIEIVGTRHLDQQPVTMLFLPLDGMTVVIMNEGVSDVTYERFVESLSFRDHFRDLNGHPLSEEITLVSQRGIFEGYVLDSGEREFRPVDLINRAELLKVLVLASPAVDQSVVDRFYVDYRMGLGRDDLEAVSDRSEETKPVLHDIQRDAWFAPYVFYAYDQGWVQGYPDGSFQPTRSVNMAELVKIVLSSRNVTLDENTEVWFQPFFDYLVGKDVLKRSEEGYQFSTEASFLSYEEATRAQVAGLLGRLIRLDEQL